MENTAKNLNQKEKKEYHFNAAPSQRPVVDEILFSGGLLLLAAALWMVLFGRFDGASLDAPVFWGSDGMQHYMVARGILDGEGPWNLSRMSAPFGLNFEGYPLLGHIDLLVLFLLSPIASEPTALVNLYWALSFGLTAVIAGACLRVLGLRPGTAFVFAALYAFLPYAFYRNVIHLSLVYWLAPPSATLAAALLGGRPLSRRTVAFLAAGCFLSGFTYAYTAFFVVFVLALAFCMAAAVRRDAMRPLLLALLLAVSGTALNLTPTVLAWRSEPGTRVTATSYKAPNHADIYGLRIRDLMTPVDAHPAPPMRHFARLVQSANYPNSNENGSVRLGLTGALGFLLLLGVSLAGAIAPPAQGSLRRELQPLAAISLGCVLLATVGGFGSIFNLLAFPDVRCYNRVAVFIAFFALAAAGLAFERATAGLSRPVRVATLVLLLTAGIADQRVDGLRNLVASNREAYETLKETAARAESALPPKGRIYQYPYYGPIFDPRWLRGGTTPPLLELGPYIVSRSSSWSAGPLTRRAVDWNERLRTLSPDLLPDCLAAQGFSGLWADRLLFENDAEGEAALDSFERILGSPVVSGDRGRFLLFDASGRRRALEALIGATRLASMDARPPERFRLRWGERVTFSPGGLGELFARGGWGRAESHGRWTIARRAGLSMTLPEPSAGRIRLRLDASPFLFHGKRDVQRIALSVNGTPVGRFELRDGGRRSLETVFDARLLRSGDLDVVLELPDAIAPAAAGIADDRRELGIFVHSLVLEETP